MTPIAIRTMRAAVGWSMRDLATSAGVAVNTVLAAEKGQPVTRSTETRIRTAFRRHGVTCRVAGHVVHVKISPLAQSLRARAAEDLAGLPYVTVRGPRADGTYRVLFEVPPRLRPEGWPPTRPLPIESRRGDLGDPEEVARIRHDAGRYRRQLHAAGNRQRNDRREPTENAK